MADLTAKPTIAAMRNRLQDTVLQPQQKIYEAASASNIAIALQWTQEGELRNIPSRTARDSTTPSQLKTLANVNRHEPEDKVEGSLTVLSKKTSFSWVTVEFLRVVVRLSATEHSRFAGYCQIHISLLHKGVFRRCSKVNSSVFFQ
jgi:hypothetical protein